MYLCTVKQNIRIMIISSKENKALYEALINNPENYNRFAGELKEFNVSNKQRGIKMPAAFIAPTVLRIDDKCKDAFFEFLTSKGCVLS